MDKERIGLIIGVISLIIAIFACAANYLALIPEKLELHIFTNQNSTVVTTPPNPTTSEKFVSLILSQSVDNPTPREGEPITYDISITNNGPDDATGVQITSLLSSGVTYISHSTGSGTYLASLGIWDIGNLASGRSTNLTIDARVDTGTAGSSITNSLYVSNLNENNQSTDTIISSAVITVSPRGTSADLEINKVVDNPTSREGEPITYDISITNNGPNDASGIEVTDPLPARLTYVEHTATGGTTYSDSTGVWDIGSLSAGASETLSIYVIVNTGTEGTSITNFASISATLQTDPDIHNNGDNASIFIGESTLEAETGIEENFCPSTAFECFQLLSCQEAKACLATGNSSLDPDRDGIPCEATLCQKE